MVKNSITGNFNVNVAIQLPEIIKEPIISILNVFAEYCQFEWECVQDGHDLLISCDDKADIQVSETFVRAYSTKSFDHNSLFTDAPVFRCQSGKPDYLSTCFYLVNCLQEYGTNKTGKYDRFSFKDSLQYKFNCVKTPLVNDYFNKLISIIPCFKGKIFPPMEKSRFLLSHDNDTLRFGYLRDFLSCIKHFKLKSAFSLSFNLLTDGYTWLNMNDIMDIEDEFNYKSVFFWLGVRGQKNANTRKINKEINNGDYSINSKDILRVIDSINDQGWENGLHKSATTFTYSEELSFLPFKAISNRNHYLLSNVPEYFKELEKSNINVDFSLGFADEIGFRNCYSLPFKPFLVDEKRVANILVVPLNIMDTTFWSYKKVGVAAVMEECLEFIENNKYNSVINILWHNKYFTDYKFNGYRQVYYKLLQKFKELGLKNILSKDLLK